MANQKKHKYIHRFNYLKLFSIVLLLISTTIELSYSQEFAFPGAEGFGRYSKGGRGGKVIKVVNLNDNGPGSLREALESEGARYVVFDVGGIINLENRINITNPFVTIAGQTAPGDGIVLRGNGINIETNNVIIRFLRIRPGDVDFGEPNNWSGIDALSIGSSDSSNVVENIIIDHCSFSWAVDENIGLWNKGKNITIQNSIISEALAMSKHPKGEHSKGMLVGGSVDKISILNNYFAHNHARNPRFSNSGLSEFRNNIIYNARGFGIKISNSTVKKTQYLDIINNHIIKGPSTKFSNPISIWKPKIYNGLVYLKGNSGFKSNEDWQLVEDWETREPVLDNTNFKSDTSFVKHADTLATLTQLIIDLVKNGGSSLPRRDIIDERIIENFLEFRGGIINSQSEIGGWGIEIEESFENDQNENGFPDEYEIEFRISSPADLNADFDEDGYLNFEEYLNGTDPYDTENEENEVFNAFLSSSEEKDQSNSNYFTRTGVVIFNNYPNPFATETIIPVWVYREQFLTIVIFNLVGQIVYKLFEGEITPGVYEFIWNPRELASGVYFVLAKNEFGINMQSITKIN